MGFLEDSLLVGGSLAFAEHEHTKHQRQRFQNQQALQSQQLHIKTSRKAPTNKVGINKADTSKEVMAAEIWGTANSSNSSRLPGKLPRGCNGFWCRSRMVVRDSR